jgi:ureidoglycolate lyase
MRIGETTVRTAAPRRLKVRALTAEAFAPFGVVIADPGGVGRPVNEGRGERLDLAHGLVHATGAVSPSMALYRITASGWPVPIAVMERHPLTAQMFHPLDGASALVVVAPDDETGAPDMDRAQAFVAGPGQGFVYGPGIWHLPLVALGRPGSFSMLMWETGDARDCEIVTLAQPLLADI